MHRWANDLCKCKMKSSDSNAEQNMNGKQNFDSIHLLGERCFCIDCNHFWEREKGIARQPCRETHLKKVNMHTAIKQTAQRRGRDSDGDLMLLVDEESSSYLGNVLHSAWSFSKLDCTFTLVHRVASHSYRRVERVNWLCSRCCSRPASMSAARKWRFPNSGQVCHPKMLFRVSDDRRLDVWSARQAKSI